VRTAGARRLAVAALAVSVFLLVAAAAPAFAAQRFASPGGSGTACTSGSPCSIVTAINSSASNDEVIVDPGTYGSPGSPLTTQLDLSGVSHENETVHGVAGQPRPVIFDDAAPALNVNTLGTTARYLDIESANLGAFVAGSGSALDQVIVHSTGSLACDLSSSGTIMNSVCWSNAADGVALNVTSCSPSTVAGTLRNVDAYATGASGVGVHAVGGTGCDVTITATNVITRGPTTDVEADNSGGTAAVNLDHSDFRGVITTNGGTASVEGTGTNITSDPALVNPSGGDFHETGGSPTIDVGGTDPANGSSDFDGQPRTEAGKTDIGADEFMLPPTVVAGASTGVGMTAATLNGTVNPNHDGTTYSFRYGTTPAMASSTTPQALATSRSTQPVSAAITGLPPDTTIYWQLVASNSAGISATPTHTFVTQPLPRPFFSNVSQAHSKWRESNALVTISRRHHRPPVGTTFNFNLNEAAAVRLDFTQRVPGRKVRGRCVAPTRHNRHKHRCTRTVSRGQLSFLGHAGANHVKFGGRISATKKLKPGKYTLVITATVPGEPPTTTKLSFTIVR
jgi:hypothetical protein